MREISEPPVEGGNYTLRVEGDEDEEDGFGISAIYTLPPNTTSKTVDMLMVYLGKPMIITHDSDGRVRALMLGGCNFYILSGMWKLVNPLMGPSILNCRKVHDPNCILQCAMIKLVDMDKEENLLITADTCELKDFENECGKLLLPHNMKIDVRLEIRKYLGGEREVAVIYDQYGRVFSLTMNTDVHLILMPLWGALSTKTEKVEISGIDDVDDSLSAIYYLGLKLFIPKNLPLEFREWQPDGEYDVMYDIHQRVYSITREADGTNIQLFQFWDQRYKPVL